MTGDPLEHMLMSRVASWPAGYARHSSAFGVGDWVRLFVHCLITDPRRLIGELRFRAAGRRIGPGSHR
jgi:hypothetical protein